MNRLVVRLVLTHVLVAVVAAGSTFAVVRLLAPALFDQSLRLGQGPMGPGGGMGGQPGSGAAAGQQGLGQPTMGQQGILRDQFAGAVDTALVWGALAGAVTAALVGALAAYRLIRPLDAVRAATRALAEGRYAVPLPSPRTTELAELTADVRRLGEELAATESRRVRLLGEVAHELRTPLTVIDGTVEAMIDGVLPADAEQLGVLTAEVRRMRRLSEDLSALSRADEGRLDLQPVEIDLREIVGPAAIRLQQQAIDADLRLDVDCGGTPVPVRADPERIAQVVTNLIGNAVRATPAGGTVTVRCAVREGQALATVADTGEGLAAEEVERIFERFYRVPGRRGGTAHDGGSGIGLTIARGIARAHGGDLQARSPGPGAGAVFTLVLPLAPTVD